MRLLTIRALATSMTLAAGACKKDDRPSTPSQPETPSTAPATEAPAATTDAPVTPPAGEAGGATAADAHKGHRHEPSDPYHCPMDPEETAREAGATCPVCGMKMEPRKR
jgi:heavy metal-binding protein